MARVRVEKVRLAWEYNAREVEIHRQRLLQLFVLFTTVAVTTLGSVVLEKVPSDSGLGVAALSFVVASYTQVQMSRLPRRLRRALEAGMSGLDTLIKSEA